MKNEESKVNLNNLASSALLSPFAKMNSVSRLDMVASAFKHCVIPVNPDYPIVDSCYTNDILLSTDNHVVHGGVKLLHKIPKVLNGRITEWCYIYEEISTKQVKLIVVPMTEMYYCFGYDMKSVFENMKEGDIHNGDSYIKYFDFYDIDNNIKSFGKNINIIYNVSKDVTEDSIKLSKSAAHKFARPHQEEIEFTISPEYILRNLYGDKDTYKPLPMVGDKLKDGFIVSMYLDDSKSFLIYDDEMLETDVKIMSQYLDAEVIDIEVYSKFTNGALSIPQLEKTRNEFNNYMQNIVNMISLVESKYPSDKIHFSVKNLKNKYVLALSTASLRWGSNELKNNIAVRYKVRLDKPLRPGDKLTNRHGGKGTDSITVLDEDIYAINSHTGEKIYIDAEINTTGVGNRENVAQMYEVGLSTLWMHMRDYLVVSNDSVDKKYSNILRWLEIAKQPETVEFLRTVDANEVVEYYKDKENDMRLTYPPYNDPDDIRVMDSNVLRELTWFTDDLIPVVPYDIYVECKKLSSKHYVGKAYYLVLANGDFKATSVRGNEGTSTKGSPSKKARDNKRKFSKFGSTAVKQSDFALSNTLNAIFPEDKKILRNNSQPIHDHLNAVGIELKEFDED